MKVTKTRGVVRNGLIVPNMPLPEGYRVEITMAQEQAFFTPDEQAEFDAWRELSAGSIELVECAAEEASKNEAGRRMAD